MTAARHELLVIAWSRRHARRPGRHLDALVAELTRPGVGLVTCLYRGRFRRRAGSGRGWANPVHQLRLPALGPGRTDGGIARRLLRRHHGAVASQRLAAGIGGFEALERSAGRRLRARRQGAGALGLELVLSPYLDRDHGRRAEPAATSSAYELRWARTMRSIAPAGYAASIITMPVYPSPFGHTLRPDHRAALPAPCARPFG